MIIKTAKYPALMQFIDSDDENIYKVLQIKFQDGNHSIKPSMRAILSTGPMATCP